MENHLATQWVMPKTNTTTIVLFAFYLCIFLEYGSIIYGMNLTVKQALLNSSGR